MARIEAWNFLKKLPDGTVSLVIRQKLKSNNASDTPENVKENKKPLENAKNWIYSKSITILLLNFPILGRRRFEFLKKSEKSEKSLTLLLS